MRPCATPLARGSPTESSTQSASDLRSELPQPHAMEGRSKGCPRVPPRFTRAVAGRYAARSDADQRHSHVPGLRRHTRARGLAPLAVVHTDTGSTASGSAGDGRGSCRPAIEDLTPLVVGEDPFLIERIWQKLYASTQGHGMTGVVGSGAITGIELALWDLKGSATASGSTATRSTRSGRASWSTGDSRR